MNFDGYAEPMNHPDYDEITSKADDKPYIFMAVMCGIMLLRFLTLVIFHI